MVTIYRLVDYAFLLMQFLIVIRCILSFIRHNPYQPVIRFVYEVTEPVMAPFRRLIPPVGSIDFSPIIVIFVLDIMRRLILSLMQVMF